MLRTLVSWRSWHNISSVHLIHKKDQPPIKHVFSQKGLIIKPTGIKVPEPQKITLSFEEPRPFQMVPYAPNTYFPLNDPDPEELPTVRAKRKRMKTSIKKVVPLLRTIRRLHVEDAIAAMEASIKKPAFWIKNIVKNAVRAGVNTKGMYQERLYIKEAFCGKNTPGRGIRYHAKGKSARMTKPKTEITIIVEEKSPEKMYEMIMLGKHSPALALFLRRNLLDSDASYEEIRKYQNLLSAKGRQQQRLMMHRKVCKKHFELAAQGLVIPKDRLQKQILEEECRAFVESYWNKKRSESDQSLAERLELYKKNEGIK